MSFALHLAAPLGWAEWLQRAVAHVEQARLAADRQRAAADDLHPRVLLRVVRGGDAHAALELELADRVVDHLGADQPEVEHVGAAVGCALDQGRGHRRRRDACVAADRDAARLEVLDVGAADRVCALLVELVRIEAADVVRLEDLGIEHEPMLWERRSRPRCTRCILLRTTMKLLAAALAAAALGLPAAHASPPTVLGLVYTPGYGNSMIARYDPVTLEQSGPRVRLGGNANSWGWSPQRRYLAVASYPQRLTVFEAATMRVVSRIRLAPGGGVARAVTWAGDRVLAVVEAPFGAVVTAVDPLAGQGRPHDAADAAVRLPVPAPAGWARLPARRTQSDRAGAARGRRRGGRDPCRHRAAGGRTRRARGRPGRPPGVRRRRQPRPRRRSAHARRLRSRAAADTRQATVGLGAIGALARERVAGGLRHRSRCHQRQAGRPPPRRRA